METLELEKIYKECGGLLEGHFLLTSGKHSPKYLQSAKVLEHPKTAELLANALARKIRSACIPIDCICSPAIGGILIGYELARSLNVRFIFTERVKDKMLLRRGFTLTPKEQVLVCEDIITTGGSAHECAWQVESQGGKVVGYAALANRGIQADRKLDGTLPLFTLGDLIFPTYDADNCPLCQKGSVAIKPGSRGN